MLYTSILSLALATSTLAWPLSFSRRATTCVSGVHIIATRGSTEDPGEGKVQPLSDLIKQSIANSDDVGLEYPATLIPYESSEETGVTNLKTAIDDYIAACPSARIVLLGYSQGAQVIGDLLGGGSFTDSDPIDYDTYSKYIVAAVQVADPAHTYPQPYDKGNSTNGGTFARSDTTALNKWSSVLASYCQSDDFFCDSGSSLTIHENEVATYEDDAAAFVVALVEG